ncbi:MAG TPA: acyl carrier protein [Thermoanaerobaculia bacterium]|nr:acyl carrier protein [Thermoanaerobaculia bacterium]
MDPRIVEEVKEKFSGIMGISPEGLDFDARLDDVYGVTSVNQMRLISELEISLGIEIPEADGKGACSLGEIARLCAQHSMPDVRVAGRA